ncbi:hypothetical protein GCM10022255_023830 [Dactylosporangium darangshiense]|uniref:Uncharacterized protein n=1 Tax=Dactylosporangium darangshiense TaxID=579108 RepID=A0ABP8D4W0_9ACTN
MSSTKVRRTGTGASSAFLRVRRTAFTGAGAGSEEFVEELAEGLRRTVTGSPGAGTSPPALASSDARTGSGAWPRGFTCVRSVRASDAGENPRHANDAIRWQQNPLDRGLYIWLAPLARWSCSVLVRWRVSGAVDVREQRNADRSALECADGDAKCQLRGVLSAEPDLSAVRV